MNLIDPKQLSLGPKYISFIERANYRYENKFWEEIILPSLINAAKNSYVLLSDSALGDFSHTYTELLNRSVLADSEIQARVPFFTNILRIPTFDINRRRKGASGWERPSVRIINGGWMVFTFECDDPNTGALEHQFDWFMGKSPAFEQVHQRLKQFKDYRGYNTVFSGNKSLHIHVWFDTRHLSRDLSKQTRRKGNDWSGDMPADAIKELYRDKWHELSQIVRHGLNEPVEFDTKLSFYAQKRRMPWGVRTIELGHKNIHNVHAGDQVLQTVIAEQYLSRKSAGSTDWFIKAQDADKIMTVEREASGEISMHPVAPQATTQLVNELSSYLRGNGWGQYPEPVEISYHDPYNYLWFKNHDGDVHPRTFVRGDYRRISPSGKHSPIEPISLPHGLTLDQTLQVLEQKITTNQSSLNIQAHFASSIASQRDMTGFAAKRFKARAVTPETARQVQSQTLQEIAELDGLWIVQSVEGIGKTRALLSHMPELRRLADLDWYRAKHDRDALTDPDEYLPPPRNGFLCFACRSYEQAEEKLLELQNLPQVSGKNSGTTTGYRGIVLKSFSQIYTDAIAITGNDPIDSFDAGQSGYGSWLEAIQTSQPRVYEEMKKLRTLMWGGADHKNKFDPKSTVLFTVHSNIQRWPHSVFTKAWLHPDCPDTTDIKILSDYAREMGFFHIIYDEIGWDDLVSMHSSEDVDLADRVNRKLKKSTGKNWDDAGLTARVRAFNSTFRSTGQTPIDFGLCDEILRARYKKHDLMSVDFTSIPFGKGTNEANEYAKQDGHQYYCKPKRWWSGLNCPVIILTTEDLPVQLIRSMNDEATSANPKFHIVQMMTTNQLFNDQVPVFWDTRARSPKKNRAGSVIDIAEELIESDFDFVIGNKLAKIKNEYRSIVCSHQSARGRNDLRGKSIGTIITYLSMAEFNHLNILGQRFGLDNPILIHYRDQIYQDLGRNLGFRHNMGQSHDDHVVIIKSDLYSFLNGFQSDEDDRYQFYIADGGGDTGA